MRMITHLVITCLKVEDDYFKINYKLTTKQFLKKVKLFEIALRWRSGNLRCVALVSLVLTFGRGYFEMGNTE